MTINNQNIQICSIPKEKTETEIVVKQEPVEQEEFFVAYIGKGKKQKRVEVKASNNLFDGVPSGLVSGAQLAFSF